MICSAFLGNVLATKLYMKVVKSNLHAYLLPYINECYRDIFKSHTVLVSLIRDRISSAFVTVKLYMAQPP